jgi:ribosomal protein L21E
MSSCDCCMPCVVCTGWTDGTGDTHPECKAKKPIEKESKQMSEFKVGDRVKIVIEDFVRHVSDEGHIQVDATVDIMAGDSGVVSIEVIQPPFVLPTKKWAQVVGDSGELWTRVSSIIWCRLDGMELLNEELSTFSGLRVLSEGVDDE